VNLFPFVVCRDFRSQRTALFDDIEEGRMRGSVYSSREIHEHDNDQAMDSLHDRVSILKRVCILYLISL
jgi:blocked-early-in-transport protein 1